MRRYVSKFWKIKKKRNHLKDKTTHKLFFFFATGSSGRRKRGEERVESREKMEEKENISDLKAKVVRQEVAMAEERNRSLELGCS